MLYRSVFSVFLLLSSVYCQCAYAQNFDIEVESDLQIDSTSAVISSHDGAAVAGRTVDGRLFVVSEAFRFDQHISFLPDALASFVPIAVTPLATVFLASSGTSSNGEQGCSLYRYSENKGVEVIFSKDLVGGCTINSGFANTVDKVAFLVEGVGSSAGYQGLFIWDTVSPLAIREATDISSQGKVAGFVLNEVNAVAYTIALTGAPNHHFIFLPPNSLQTLNSPAGLPSSAVVSDFNVHSNFIFKTPDGTSYLLIGEKNRLTKLKAPATSLSGDARPWSRATWFPEGGALNGVPLICLVAPKTKLDALEVLAYTALDDTIGLRKLPGKNFYQLVLLVERESAPLQSFCGKMTVSAAAPCTKSTAISANKVSIKSSSQPKQCTFKIKSSTARGAAITKFKAEKRSSSGVTRSASDSHGVTTVKVTLPADCGATLLAPVGNTAVRPSTITIGCP